MISDIDYSGRDPRVGGILQWFECDHLPRNLQETSRYFQVLAVVLVNDLPDGEELIAGLRKILEAKDCFVRATIERDAK